MPKLGENYRQALDETTLEELPEFCEYVGPDTELAYLRGKLIPTKRVQELVYVGERENIVVTLADGTRAYPWRNACIWQEGPDGLPVWDSTPLPPETDEPKLSCGDLAGYGLTDAALDSLARELLGVGWTPDRAGPSAARKRMLDAIFAKAYG